MPHPVEVIPQKKILRELLHEVDPPPFLDVEQLIRLLCSQQLRLERRIEEGLCSILEELQRRPASKACETSVCEPDDRQHESMPAGTANTSTICHESTMPHGNTLSIKPTPSTHLNGNGHGESQANRNGHGDGVPDASPYTLVLTDSMNAIIDPSEGGATETPSKKANGTASDNLTTASKSLYDNYKSKNTSTSCLSNLQRLIRKRLPDGMLKSLLLFCTSRYGVVLKFLERICEHSVFGMVAASFIIFNALTMAFSVDWLATHDDEAPWMALSTLVCNIFFIIELVMRSTYQGAGFFMSKEKHWNMFDFTMVVLILVELVTSSSKFNVGQSIKMVKILRIVRIFRLFRFFEDLSLMVTMIIGSIKSLIWAWILIFIIIFSFSIVLTQFTTYYVNQSEDSPEDIERARMFFGTIRRTVYSLIQAMLGGKSWGEYTDVLLYVDLISVFIFFMYIALMMIAVMNVITGVFVQDAIQAASKQRDVMISSELRSKEKDLENMLDMFTAMDTDGSGEISIEEAKEFLRQEVWAAYFAAQGLDVADAEWIFTILDIDRNGSIPFEEFVEGCFKLKGPAKRTDVVALSQVVDRMYAQMKILNANFDPIGAHASNPKNRSTCASLLPMMVKATTSQTKTKEVGSSRS